MESTTSERIATMMAELEVDQTEFAAIAGASKSVVNQWLSGLIKSVGAKYAYQIEKKHRYSAEWIQTGRGDKKLIDGAPTSRDSGLPGEDAPTYLSRKAAPSPPNPATHKALYDLARELARGDLSPEVQALLTSELEAKAKFVRKQLAKFNKQGNPHA